jgi:hypothetical protein
VIGEYEERKRCDRSDPGGQPVEPIDEVDRVDGEHRDQNRDGNADVPAQHQRAGVAPGNVDRRKLNSTEGDHDASGRDLAGELGQRIEFVLVVQYPDRADHGTRDQDPVDIGSGEERRAQGRKLVSH